MKRYVLLFSFLASVQVSAEDLLKFAAEHAFDPTDAARVGIEVEMAGLNTKNIAQITQKYVGGDITVVPNEYGFPEYHILRSQVGKLIVKPEDNSSSTEVDIEKNYEKTRITEIVTEPLHYPQVEKLQEAMDALKAAGAEGTKEGHAVSIQTNEEIGRGRPQDFSTKIILDPLRNFLDPLNRQNIGESLDIAEFRQKYIGPFSPGFMRKLQSSAYDPSWREFYNDFMYRQSAELIGVQRPWSRPLSEVKMQVMGHLNTHGFEKIMQVVKWNDIRISSLMIYIFPHEPLSKYLVETTWFRGYPAVENRVRDNDFNVKRAVRENLGLSRLSREFGRFDSSLKSQFQDYLKQKQRVCSKIFGN